MRSYDMAKQTNPDHLEPIRTDGCLFMSLASIAVDYADTMLYPEDINELFWYVTPWHMRDGLHAREDRCLVLDHPAIIRAALRMLLTPNEMPVVEYVFRDDEDASKCFGDVRDKERCTAFITEVQMTGYTHFFRSDKDCNVVYNPGRSWSREIVSYRGYYLGVE